MLRTVRLLPQQGFRHWASTPRVSPRNRQPATGPPDSYPDRTHTGKRRQAYEHRSPTQGHLHSLVAQQSPTSAAPRGYLATSRRSLESSRHPETSRSVVVPVAGPERRQPVRASTVAVSRGVLRRRIRCIVTARRRWSARWSRASRLGRRMYRNRGRGGRCGPGR
jgi:hypothetical protein